jgi:formylglycine-generating enzyme required for sulfatase activity/serine/threonine protein kinase
MSAHIPSRLASDRNLLFGILALQMDFIGREALIAAMHAWVLDKAKPLSAILQDQGALAEDERAALETLVEKHLRKHGGDPERSLEAVASGGAPSSVRDELRRLGDPDLDASLAHVGGEPAPPGLDGPSPSTVDLAGDEDTPLCSPVRYRVLRPHAKGGLGEVFVAEDKELHREVALKEIQKPYAHDAHSRGRFLLEAEVNGRLEHPGVVPVYGLGCYRDGRPFYAMRFIRGESLQEAIKRFHAADVPGRDVGERGLALRQLLGQFVAVCNAVAYAHSRGVLHRDIKPGNVMLGQFGETLVVDWGLAKVLGRADAANPEGPLRPSLGGDSPMTQAGAALGTPAYMSPEQAAGRLEQLGPRSDVYSLGATLYCLLSGRAPFAQEDMGAVLSKVQRGDFPPPRQVNRQIPPPLEAVCLKAMALRPEGRYATPRELAEEIERWLADEPVRAYREPLSARLGRWVRRHQTAAAGVGALLLTGVIALSISTLLVSQAQRETAQALKKEERARRDRALAQVEQLRTADPRAVPAILKSLEPSREEVLPHLRELWAREGHAGDSTRRMRVALALLPTDPGAVKQSLYEWMLNPTTDAREALLARDALRPHAVEFKAHLWASTGGGPAGIRVDAADLSRFRALAALAALDPGDPRWQKVATEAVSDLLYHANALNFETWVEAFRPVRTVLAPPLRDVCRDRKYAERHRAATNLLADYAADLPGLLVDVSLDADERQYLTLLPKIKNRRDAVLALLHAELAKEVPEKAPDEHKDRLAFRQANAAVTLLHLGESQRVWPLLKHTPDPSRRTYLSHHLGRYGVDVRVVVDQLKKETDVSARRALLLSLGEYRPLDKAVLPEGGVLHLPPADRQQQVARHRHFSLIMRPTGGVLHLPSAERQELVVRLVQDYRDDPDPGIHSAIEWVLRQWKEDGKLPKLRNHRPKDPPRGKPTWYVNGQGQTFAVIPGPVEFQMGSPESDPDHLPIEAQHWRKIPRSFAVATKEVTVSDFRRFLEANPEIGKNFSQRGIAESFLKKHSPTEEGPIIAVDWYTAAAYCNWLSQKEGLPEAEWCYPKGLGKIRAGILMEEGYLKRKGYRLPTEAEWEYACRAGAATSRFYGRSEALLGKYAWFYGNAGDRAHPVGRVRPNDLGLFDVLGNVGEWCQDRFTPLVRKAGEAVEDVEDKDQSDAIARMNRGGSFLDPAMFARSSRRDRVQPLTRSTTLGLRVARTCE